MGVSVRRLHGWEPSVRTSYVYDDAGRLLESIETREAEFTPNELAVLLLSRIDDAKRGPHGIPMDIATDPENKGRFVAEATVDFAQAELDRLQDLYREEYGHQKQYGFRYTVHLPDAAESAP